MGSSQVAVGCDDFYKWVLDGFGCGTVTRSVLGKLVRWRVELRCKPVRRQVRLEEL
jgi:hypothetical protein